MFACRYFKLLMSVLHLSYISSVKRKNSNPVSIYFGEGSPYMMSGEVQVLRPFFILSPIRKWLLSLFYAPWIPLLCSFVFVCETEHTWKVLVWFLCLQCFWRPAEISRVSVRVCKTLKGKLHFLPIYIFSFTSTFATFQAIRFIPRQSHLKQAQMYLLGCLNRLY